MDDKQFLKEFQEIEADRQQVEVRRRRLLEKRGWKYTSETPDSCWWMVKQLPDGRTAMVDEETAAGFEERAAYDNGAGDDGDDE